MKPIDYWNSLEIHGVKKGIEKHQPLQTAFAVAAGSSFNYFYKHIFKKSGRSRNPGSKLLIKISCASKGNVSLDEAIDYFLVQPVKQLASETEVKPSSTSIAPKHHSPVATNALQTEMSL